MKTLSADIQIKLSMTGMKECVQLLKLGRTARTDYSTNTTANYSSPEVVFVYYILYTLAHLFHMWQRSALNDSE